MPVSPAPEPPAPPAATGRRAGSEAQPVFVASCLNCTRWQGSCALGRVLPPGKLLCPDYEITPVFRDQLVGVMMKDILTQVRVTAERVQKLRAAQRLWN